MEHAEALITTPFRALAAAVGNLCNPFAGCGEGECAACIVVLEGKEELMAFHKRGSYTANSGKV